MSIISLFVHKNTIVTNVISVCYFCIAATLLLQHNIYEIISTQYYVISIIIPVALLLMLSMQRMIVTKLSIIDILLYILLIWILFHSIINKVSIDNIFKVVTLGILYIYVKLCYGKSGNIDIIILPFLIIGGIESILFLFDYISGVQEDIITGGTFGNSARLSGFLLIGTPVCIHGIKSSNKILRNIYGIIFILNNSVIILAFSRAAIIGLLFAYVYLAYKNSVIRISKRMIITFIIVILLLVVSLVFLKYDSAIGRLLIWKISITKLYPYFLLGKGIDSFTSLYNGVQSEYFSDKFGIFDNETNLAGFVAYPYNELLNILIELGLIPCLLIVIMLYILLKSVEYKQETVYIKSAVIAALIFSMFSYTSKIYPMLLIFIIYFAVLDSNRLSICKKIVFKPSGGVRYITIAVLVSIFIFQTISLVQYEGWKRGNELYGTWDKAGALEEIKRYTGRFKGSNIIMTEYGRILYDMENYEACIEILNHVAKKFPDPNILVLQARAYIQINEYDQAEELLIKAANTVPSKFEAKYWLFKLYEKTDIDKAFNIANVILCQPIKITSDYVLKVKQEVTAFIKSFPSGALEAEYRKEEYKCND